MEWPGLGQQGGTQLGPPVPEGRDKKGGLGKLRLPLCAMSQPFIAKQGCLACPNPTPVPACSCSPHSPPAPGGGHFPQGGCGTAAQQITPGSWCHTLLVGFQWVLLGPDKGGGWSVRPRAVGLAVGLPSQAWVERSGCEWRQGRGRLRLGW